MYQCLVCRPAKWYSPSCLRRLVFLDQWLWNTYSSTVSNSWWYIVYMMVYLYLWSWSYSHSFVIPPAETLQNLFYLFQWSYYLLTQYHRHRWLKYTSSTFIPLASQCNFLNTFSRTNVINLGEIVPLDERLCWLGFDLLLDLRLLQPALLHFRTWWRWSILYLFWPL